MSLSQNNQTKIVSKSAKIIGKNICNSSSDPNIAEIVVSVLQELMDTDEYREKMSTIMEESAKRIVLDLNGNKIILAHLLSNDIEPMKQALLNLFQYVISNYAKDLISSGENFVEVFNAKLSTVLNDPETLLQLKNIRLSSDLGKNNQEYGGVSMQPGYPSNMRPGYPSNMRPGYPSNMRPRMMGGGGEATMAEDAAESVEKLAEGDVKSKEISKITSEVGTSNPLKKIQEKTSQFGKSLSNAATTAGSSISGTAASIMGSPHDGEDENQEEDSEEKEDSVVDGFDFRGLMDTLESVLKSEIESRKSEFFDKLSSGVQYSVVQSRNKIIDVLVQNMDIAFEPIRNALHTETDTKGTSSVGDIFLYQLLANELDAFTESITTEANKLHSKLKGNRKKFHYNMMNDPIFVIEVCSSMKNTLLGQFYRKNNPDALAVGEKKRGGRSFRKNIGRPRKTKKACIFKKRSMRSLNRRNKLSRK
jgi:hypothetical protein